MMCGKHKNSTVHRNNSNNHIIINCSCDMGFEHGQLELKKDINDPQCFYVELWFRPHYHIIQRIKQAWSVLCGKNIFCDNYWNKDTSEDIAEWLKKD